MMKTHGAWTWRLRAAQPENERTKEKGLNCEARLRKKKRKKKIESDGGGCCCWWIKKRK
jgi:ribosome assembly protein YihI (activator of Der GTPase)